jgi:chromate transporter
VLAVGGAITLASEMQRYLVVEHGWIDALQFNAAIAIAQAAPGPTFFSWDCSAGASRAARHAGHAGGHHAAVELITFVVGRLRQAKRDALAVQAFSVGLAPLTIGLLWPPLGAGAAAGDAPVSMLLVPRPSCSCSRHGAARCG